MTVDGVLLVLLELSQRLGIASPRRPLGLAHRFGAKQFVAAQERLLLRPWRRHCLQQVNGLIVGVDLLDQVLGLLLLGFLREGAVEPCLGLLLLDPHVLARPLRGLLVLLGGVLAVEPGLIVRLGVTGDVRVGATRVQRLVHGLVGLLADAVRELIWVRRLAEIEPLPRIPRRLDVARIVGVDDRIGILAL